MRFIRKCEVLVIWNPPQFIFVGNNIYNNNNTMKKVDYN